MKFEFLKSMGSVSLKKTFFVENILEKCSISNKNRAKVKRLIMNGFSVLIEETVIESSLELINKTRSSLIINDETLTPLLIGKSDEIHFWKKMKTQAFLSSYNQEIDAFWTYQKVSLFLLNKAFKQICEF